MEVTPPKKKWRKKTPTVIQMEAVECGAACLGIILGYFGKFVPLEELREECGVSRDGSNALKMIQASRKYGLEGKGFKKEIEALYALGSPMVILWEFNHFLVVEGFGKDKVFLNDPANGPCTVSYEEFDAGYNGIVITFNPTAEFQKGGAPLSLTQELLTRLKPVRVSLLYVFAVGLCLLLPGLSLPAFVRIFVDHMLITDVISWKWLFLWSVVLSGALAAVLIWLQNYVLNRMNAKLSIQFSSHFLWHILRLPVFFYSQRFPGEIAYRTTLNNAIAKQMSGSLASTLVSLVLVVFYGVAMLFYDVGIGLMAFGAAFLTLLVFIWIQRTRSDAYARLQQENGKWIGNSLGALQHIETIKAAGIESDFFGRFSGFYAKYLNAQQEISKKDALLGTTPILMQALALAGLLTLGSMRVMQGALSFGMLVALQTLLISFLTPIAQFVNFGQSMQNIKVDINRLNDVLKNEVDPIYHERLSTHAPFSKKLEGYLEFRNVTFGYNPTASPLIENLSFSIKPGERLALVGPSGCGKSTIAKLVAGLYFPWSGQILYDGQPLKKVPAEVFYHSFGHVDQDVFLFSGTIHENLSLWNPSVTEEMMQDRKSNVELQSQR